MSDTTSPTCVFMFKKRSIKNKGARKRHPSSSDEDTEAANPIEASNSAVITPIQRKRKDNPNIQTTSKTKLSRTEESNSDSDQSEAVIHSYKSKRTAVSSGPSDQGATATLEIETERDRDAQAIFEKRLEVNKSLEGKADDKLYRGLNNYIQYITPKDTAAGNASSGMVRKGPIRAPSNLRSTVRWDYQPDICKDYKETGFCGFGDSCKFLHDRSDYKHGWQLEKEWTSGDYGKEDGEDERKYEIDSDEDNLPFKCVICRNSFKSPIVTKCNHYFCEECALKQYRKTTRCFVCNAQTNGVFNPAKELIQKLKVAEMESTSKNDDRVDSD